MKIIFRKTPLLLTLVLSTVMTSSVTYAIDLPTANARTSDIKTNLSEKQQEICKKFTSSQLSGRLEEKKGLLEQTLENHIGELDTKRSDWDKKRAEERMEADAKRQEHYDALMAVATTDVQKEAVTEFKNSVENAVSVRRAAQDVAREEYRKGIDTALTDKRNSISGASTRLKDDIDAAIAKATLSCENGTPLDDVMKTLKADLEAARAAFKTDTKDDESISDTIKSLADTRKSAIEKAKTDFQKSLEDARDTLKSALGQ